MLIRNLPKHTLNSLIAALLAPQCAGCDAILDSPIDGCVCRNCWACIRFITPPVCDGCGDPVARPDDYCRRCRNGERTVDRCRSVGEYDGVLRALLHALKYDGRISLAQPIGVLMRSRGASLLERADFVVPVPLHWMRRYRRGFNQARELARETRLPVIDALKRHRHTRPQIELPAERRQANVREAFALRTATKRSGCIEGSRIVLVDDVMTTGATLEACAKVLKAAGAVEVCALTAAKVIARRS